MTDVLTQAGLNYYIGFFGGKEIEIRAATAYAALLEARRIFKPRKKDEFLVCVEIVAHADGVEIIHLPLM